MTREELKVDKKFARHYEDCALGDYAFYYPFLAIPRIKYVDLKDVTRVFKRLAVSKGFYESNRIFGSIAYFVLKLSNGKEVRIKFNSEEAINDLLIDFKQNTKIPVGKQ